MRNTPEVVVVMGLLWTAWVNGAAAQSPRPAEVTGIEGSIPLEASRAVPYDELEMLTRARAELGMRKPGIVATDPGDAIRQQAIETEVEVRLREAEREAELDQITASIRRRAAARHGMRADEQVVTANTAQPSDAGSETIAATRGTRATILLSLSPGSLGIRRLAPSADPILCMPDVCWISRGPDIDARMVPRRRALGVLNTLGGRAGACNGRLNCVFRNVELTPAASAIEPVDLRVVQHDRREVSEIKVDETCRMAGAGVSCSAGVTGPDYLMWAVPEVIARQAGGAVLAASLRSTISVGANRPR